eukprot:881227-Rhodomonas_salina.1
MRPLAYSPHLPHLKRTAHSQCAAFDAPVSWLSLSALRCARQDTAKKTFAFCVNYKRKVEFRRLKDLLKTHLNVAQLSHMVQPTSEASLRLRVEVRAEQLNAATKLELWQLAFESAEELHNVISHPANRKAFKSKVMMSYYDKMSQVRLTPESQRTKHMRAVRASVSRAKLN